MSNFSRNFEVIAFIKFVKNTTSQNVKLYGQQFEGQHHVVVGDVADSSVCAQIQAGEVSRVDRARDL